MAATVVTWLSARTISGMFLGALVLGRAADRFGRRGAFLLNLGLYSLFSLVGAFSPNAVWLMVSRFCAGIGLGAELPLADTYLTDLLPARRRGRYVAWAYTGVVHRGAVVQADPMGPVAVHGQGGRVDGFHRGHGVTLDARDLNEPADGIAGESQVVLDGDLRGILDLGRSAAEQRRQSGGGHRASRPHLALAAADRRRGLEAAGFLERSGNQVHRAATGWPASRHTSRARPAGTTLHGIEAIRRMDEVLLANFMILHDVVDAEGLDLVVGDEASSPKRSAESTTDPSPQTAQRCAAAMLTKLRCRTAGTGPTMPSRGRRPHIPAVQAAVNPSTGTCPTDPRGTGQRDGSDTPSPALLSSRQASEACG